MIKHEEIRKLLPLAAAAALEACEQRTVQQHVRECEECRRELEILGMYSYGLKAMPQPAVPEGLLERTRLSVAEAGWAASEQRWRDLMLALVVLLSWLAGAGLWLTVREVTGGAASALGVSVLLVWTTASAAVVLLGKRGWTIRRIL